MKNKKEKILFFTNELKIMLKGGLTFSKSIELVLKNENNTEIKKILKKILKNISSGKTIHESFKNYTNIFGLAYIQLLRIGELSGTLVDRLDDITNSLEYEITNRKKIISLLIYPIVVIFFTISVVIFLLLFILPSFISMFEENNVELPKITKFLLCISENFLLILCFLIFFIVLLYFFNMYINNNKEYKIRKDRYFLRIFIFGDLLKIMYASKIYYLLYTLLNVGIGVVESMEILYENTNNSYLKLCLLEVKKSLLDGSSISKSLIKLDLYADRFSTLILAGEESGYFLENLLQISNILKQDFEYRLKKIISFVEPVVIVLLGLIVGFIICAIYIPILSIGNVFN